jgi:hypothetical protein
MTVGHKISHLERMGSHNQSFYTYYLTWPPFSYGRSQSYHDIQHKLGCRPATFLEM